MIGAGWPEGVGLVELDSVDSTMAEARRRAAETPGDFWVHALTQTAGTGRRGRRWESPRGNFSASLLLRPGEPPERMALRSFVAALALDEALSATTGRPEWFALKWPNDVLLRGRKLAGILLESMEDALIVGIGVNLVAAPPPEALEPGAVPPAALAETGTRIAPRDFLGLLAPAFAAWETRLRTYGFGPVREAWLARAARLGEPIVARLPGEEIAGVFSAVDDAGRLVLETARGRRAIAAGEVFFGGGR